MQMVVPIKRDEMIGRFSRSDKVTQQPISDDVALRIALAVRQLPDVSTAQLLKVLNDCIGLPPSIDKLESLSVKQLKGACDGEFADIDTAALKLALGELKGERDHPADALPDIAAYQEGDMPESIRLACASNHGELLDGHFGSCKRFLIYQISADAYRLIDIRSIDADREQEDKNGYRASLIHDCQLLYIVSIGGPAAAKVVRAGVHPIKKSEGGTIIEELEQLQQALQADPPPWLAKVMGQTPQQRIRFEPQELEA
jgi:nitrogen fixation protein NifX